MSETTWHGIRVALDELEASGADPTALVDLVALYGAACGDIAGRVGAALRSAGWVPPPKDPDEAPLEWVETFFYRWAGQFAREVYQCADAPTLVVSLAWEPRTRHEQLTQRLLGRRW